MLIHALQCSVWSNRFVANLLWYEICSLGANLFELEIRDVIIFD